MLLASVPAVSLSLLSHGLGPLPFGGMGATAFKFDLVIRLDSGGG